MARVLLDVLLALPDARERLALQLMRQVAEVFAQVPSYDLLFTMHFPTAIPICSWRV